MLCVKVLSLSHFKSPDFIEQYRVQLSFPDKVLRKVESGKGNTVMLLYII